MKGTNKGVPLRLDGRVAIITGGGRGIGRAHALTLAGLGASLVVNDLGTTVQGIGTDVAPADDVVAEIRAAGGAAVANPDDVSTIDGAEAMVKAALDNFGRVDIVVNNAGISTIKGLFINHDLEDLLKHISVHLVGAFNVTRAAWPHMVDNAYGRVVMTTSSSVLGKRESISYASAKSGMIGLTKSLALEGLDHNIRVNAIAPAAETRMAPNVTTLPSGEELPIPPENTSAVVALLSHECCPANGEIICVGAGRVSRLFIGDTLGYTSRGVLEPRAVMEHWDEVIDEDDYYVPLDCTYHADRLRNPSLLTSSGAVADRG